MTQPKLAKPQNFSTDPSREAEDYAAQFLRFRSILRRGDTMSPGRVDGIVKHVERRLTWMAVAEEGESDWISRALVSGDIPPTNALRDWLETTGTTSETFVAAAIGDGTNIRDDTFIGIYGCKWLAAPSRLLASIRAPYRPPVTAVRFTVGGSRVAEWDLYEIWRSVGHVGPNSSATEKLGGMIDYPVGIAESPILIGQGKGLLIEYYEQVPTTAQEFVLQLLGIVVEKRAGGLAQLSP
jgi:hypothetical protein